MCDVFLQKIGLTEILFSRATIKIYKQRRDPFQCENQTKLYLLLKLICVCMEFHYVENISIKFTFWNEAGAKGLINIVNKQLATWLLFIKFLVNKSKI